MDFHKTQITAQRLVLQLESAETHKLTTSDYYAALRAQATVEYVKSLLDQMEPESEGKSSWASTSKSTPFALPRGSAQDLRQRLSKAEAALNLSNLVDSLRPTPQPSKYASHDFLPPSIPEPPIILAQPAPPTSPLLDDPTPTPLAEITNLLPSSSSVAPLEAPIPPSPTSTLRSRPTASPAPPTTTTTPLMEHHLSLQTSLLSSLTSMSSQLKSNSLHLSDSLAKDRSVVENAQSALGVNLDRMKKEGGRLGAYERKSRGTTCAVIGTVGAVAVVWVAVFLLIKVT